MILITGASGQLGQALTQRLTRRAIEFTAVQRPAFDFEKPETLIECFAQRRPSFVINAAAYTAVDKAEEEPQAAQIANHTGPLALARLCEAADIPLIHISTDYVFDGNKGAPYLESDRPNPTGVYGASKRDGEDAVLSTHAKAIILRTAWVYSAYGKNFALTMLAAGRKMPVLRVVADQCGTPTSACDLADAILKIIDEVMKTGWRPDYRGLFHATNAGDTSWYSFACAIFAEAAKYGYKAPEVKPIMTSDWPTPTRRPPDSRLDCSKLKKVFGISMTEWELALKDVIADCLSSPSV